MTAPHRAWLKRVWNLKTAIVAGAAALIAVAWGFVDERVGYERAETTESIIASNDALVLAYEQQVLRTLQLIDQAIRFVRTEYTEHGAAFSLRHAFESGSLDSRVFLYAAVVDVHGHVVASSTSQERADVSDRDYFQYHRETTQDLLWIGQPTIGRLSGKWSIHLTRPIYSPDGRFAGVALVAVTPDFLAEGQGSFNIGEHGMMLFAGLDGFARVRRTGAAIAFGGDMRGSRLYQQVERVPVGNFVTRGIADGIPRFTSYRQLRGYPYVAALGVSAQEALAVTKARAAGYYAGAGIVTLLIALVAGGLLLALTRGEHARRMQQRSDARYRATFEQTAVGMAHADLEGRFTKVNRRLCGLLGYTEAELLGRPWQAVTHAEDLAHGREYVSDLLAGSGAPVAEMEKRYRRKDGRELCAVSSVTLVRDEEGRPEYFVAAVQDITQRKQAECELRESERRFSDLLARVELVSLMLDRNARITYCNDYLLKVTGWEREEVLGRNWFELFIPSDQSGLAEVFAALLDDLPQATHHDNEIVTRAGERRMIRWNNTVLRSAHGEVVGTASIGEDITDQLRAEREIAKAEARYRATFDQNAVGIAHASLDGRFLKVNQKFASMLGYEETELVGRTSAQITHPDDLNITVDAATDRVARMQEDSFVPEYEKRYLRKDGSVLWVGVSLSLVRDESSMPEYFIAIVKDIAARKQAEARLVHQAHYDALTELPNRTLFHDRLAQTLSQARRHDWTAGLILLDLDRFKSVNDTLGHAIGDLLLQEVAKRLDQCVRGGDTVARFGGDEFAIIAAELADAQDAALVGQKVLDALALPFDLQGHEVFIGASMGIATFPLDGRDGSVLVKNADAAMFRAKELGRNNYQFYTAAMNEQAMENLLLENDLRRALERDEFRLHYQPKASLANGRIVGFEALLRWERPGNGLVSPAKFVPLLEDTGLIVPVGEWVIRTACAQLAAWREAGAVPLPIAINLAAKQFMHGDIAGVINAALNAYGLPPTLLHVEITESDAMKNPEQTLRTLRSLQDRGVGIAIDDFGTGYSSLSYVKRFPVDTLKLDRSFVNGLPNDPDDVSIALAVIKMAHSLGLEVVAEGVETAEQRAFLARNGCDQMQGYLLSRPKPAVACAEYLPQHEEEHARYA